MKRGNGIRSVVALLCAVIIAFTGINLHADAGFKAFNQNDYDYIPYGRYGTLQSSGCGVVAFMNCVYYLTGKKLDPKFIADYSVSVGARQYGSGTSVRILTQNFIRDYGNQYKLSSPGTYGNLSDIKSYVGNGKAAICGITSGSSAGHFIVLAEYDRSRDSFYILDANPRDVRNTWPNGVGWLSASRLYNLSAWNFTHIEYYGGAFAYEGDTTKKPTETAKPTTTVPPTTTDKYFDVISSGNVIPEININNYRIVISHSLKPVTFEELLQNDGVKALCDKAEFTHLLNEDESSVDISQNVTTGMKLSLKYANSSETYTVIYMGDVNSDGKITTLDSRNVLRYTLKLDNLSFYGEIAADADCNGSVNSADARKILRVSLKLTLI